MIDITWIYYESGEPVKIPQGSRVRLANENTLWYERIQAPLVERTFYLGPPLPTPKKESEELLYVWSWEHSGEGYFLYELVDIEEAAKNDPLALFGFTFLGDRKKAKLAWKYIHQEEVDPSDLKRGEDNETDKM